MPELPEVERSRRLAATCAGRRVERARCAEDPIVLVGCTAAEMERALAGRQIVGAGRWGKHLWLELDTRPWPMLHLGMTGAIVVPGATPLKLATGPRTEAGWPPRFTKLELVLEGGGGLAFTCARRLGRLRLVDTPTAEPPVCNLGFDPLLAMPRLTAFRARIGRRKVTLKALLLDQSFAAGVGNWIADEVLYQARLDPRRRTDSLRDEEIAALHRRLAQVVRAAVRVDADSDRYPRGWLFHRRWGRDPQARTVSGEPIEHIEIAGRTTAWVPTVQR